MRAVELFELQAQEGPCMDCYRSGLPVITGDLQTVGVRWPRFSPMAITAGFRAADAVPLRLGTRILGALNLFRDRPGAMSGEDLVAAQALADIATIAIVQHRKSAEARAVNDQLSLAVSSRVVIEQAKGVLAGRERVSMEAAFHRAAFVRAEQQSSTARRGDRRRHGELRLEVQPRRFPGRR